MEYLGKWVDRKRVKEERRSAECIVGAVGNFRAFYTLQTIVRKIIRG